MPNPAAATPRRPRNPQGTGSRLREELMQAADRLLERTGDEAGLTLRAVAREAGVAAPSVYLHFASKQDLIEHVMLGHFGGLRRALEAAIDGVADPVVGLRAGCLAYCRFAFEQPGAYRIMFGNLTVGLDLASFEDSPGADTFGILVGGVVGCMEAGVIPAADPLPIATRVWIALHGIVTLRWSVPFFPWPPAADLVEEMLVGLVGIPRRGDDQGPGDNEPPPDRPTPRHPQSHDAEGDRARRVGDRGDREQGAGGVHTPRGNDGAPVRGSRAAGSVGRTTTPSLGGRDGRRCRRRRLRSSQGREQ